MKQFILNRTGDTPVMEQVPTEKIKVYESTEKAELALDDLQTGEVIATKDTAYNMGLPLGSVIAHEGDVIPNNFLLCDGSTFDKTKYPLLYALLGSNKTPVISSHDELGDPEDVTLPTSAANAMTMERDGILTVSLYIRYSKGLQASAITNINGKSYTQTLGTTWGEDNVTNQQVVATYPFKAGDVIYVAGSGNYTIYQSIRYYEGYKIIKATEGGYEKSDYVFSLLTAYNSPDYANATPITFTDYAWTAEEDGWIAGRVEATGHGTGLLTINGVIVAQVYYNNGEITNQAVFAKVSQGDIVGHNAGINVVDKYIQFVPHK